MQPAGISLGIMYGFTGVGLSDNEYHKKGAGLLGFVLFSLSPSPSLLINSQRLGYSFVTSNSYLLC